MQLIPEYTNPLGTCTACRSARRQEERIVDLGGQVELLALDRIPGVEFAIIDGDWQICETCVTEMARLLGMETPERVAQAQQVAKDALAKSVQLEAELKDTLEALEYRRKVQAVADRVFGEEKA